MYHDLDAFLILKLIETNHGQKAMYKKAVEMYTGKVKVKPEVAQGFIKKSIAERNVKHAARKINEYIADYLYYALPARELGDQGQNGMVIYDGTVYPIVVSYETADDYHWAVANEHEVYTAALFYLTWLHRVSTNIEAEFLMFATYGYRGIPHWWSIKNIGTPLKYADLLYYPGEGEALPPTYVHNELAEQQAAAKRVLIEQA